MTKSRLILLLALATAPSCWSTFLPGRCDQASDCAPGLVCNLAPTPAGNGRCVSPADGGNAGQSGGAAGAGEGGVNGRDSGAGGADEDAGGDVKDGDAGTDVGADVTDADAGIEVAPEVKPGCLLNSECPSVTPICDPAGVCRRCDANTVSSTACTRLDASRPVCGPDGQCIVCASSADCKADPAKPICDVANQKCVACTLDSQCVSKLGANPGVCMAHQDGRCATDAETFYVSNQAGCLDTAGIGGTFTVPFCTLEPAVESAASTRSLIVVRGSVAASVTAFSNSSEVSLIGQQNAIVISTGTTGLSVASPAKLYSRGLAITAPAGIGISAGGGSTLRLERVTVSNSNKGGIQLSGAAFDIANSTITGNGPGSDGAVFWGGIYVQFPPTTGPSRLTQVTITNNKSSGISCTNAITGSGVLATGNGGDITATCGFASCANPGPACGAQP